MFGLLRQRNFALFWAAVLISTIGDWVLLIGLPIYIYTLTHSVVATGGMMLAARIPRILLGPVGGVLADRWDRKRTVVVTNLLLAAIVLLLLLARTPALVWVVYVQCALVASVEQFLMPAGAALLPSLVKDHELVAANSLSALCGNLARLIGPAIGGVVAARSGLTGMVVVDSITFLTAAVLVALIVAQPRSAQPASERAVAEPSAPREGRLARGWREWTDGLGVIRREPTLRTLLIALGVSSVGEGVFGLLFPVFVVQVLHGGPGEMGNLLSTQAVGSLIGGLIIGRIGSRALSRSVIGGSAIAGGCICSVLFHVPRFYPAFGLQAALFVLLGISAMGVLTGFQALSQLRSPELYRGRISSTMNITVMMLGLCGMVIASLTADRFGVVAVLNLQGLAYLAAGALVLTMLPAGQPIKPHVAAAS